MKVMKRRLSSGVLPGAWRRWPVSVVRLQLLCLPLPLMPAKGFSWSRQRKPWWRGDVAHQRHNEHIVVDSQVAFLINRSELKLVGATSLWRVLQGMPNSSDWISKSRMNSTITLGNGAKVVVVHLLVFGRIVSHQGSARQEQVGTRRIKTFIHQEIFLFPTQIDGDTLHPSGRRIEQQPLQPCRWRQEISSRGPYSRGLRPCKKRKWSVSSKCLPR